jgi:hypothetical protein
MSNFLENHKEAKISERKLYTGICPVNVIAINPTVDDLKKIYNKDEVNEPQYLSVNEEGRTKCRLDFYIKSDLEDVDLLTKFSIYLEDKEDVSASGKKRFINLRTQSMYANSVEEIATNPNLTWFDIKTARVAKVGEVQLYEMLVRLTNASIEEDSRLELSNLDAMIKGNVSELREINEKVGKGLKVLLGVKDNQYQDVYNRFFMKKGQTRMDAMVKNATGEYGSFKSDFQDSMTLQEYVVKPMPEDDSVVDNTSSSAMETKHSMF